LGIYIAICVGGGLWLGAWADARWHTEPWFTLAGGILGPVCAFYGVYNEVARLGKGK
jgi:F0F1-type ATP synthase assembly protein I